jgi:hypothetical protein
LVIERILRDREGLWTQVRDEVNLKKLVGQMLLSATAALACYGAVLGAQGESWQVLASAIKLPILFVATLAICLPTLYLFNLVLGARLSVWQAAALVMAAITVIGVLSLAFAPITLFFLVTAPNYSFYKLLNVAILVLAAIIGLGILVDGMRSLNRAPSADPAEAAGGESAEPAPPAAAALPPAPAEPRVNMTLLRVWVLLFGFVGTQLAWTLRPFVGSPDQGFQIFRSSPALGNFYVNIAQTLGDLF